MFLIKLCAASMVAAAAFVVTMSPVSALPNGGRGAPAPIATANVGSEAQAIRKHKAILAVRKEALALQQADGGKLTEQHRAYLQAKLDAVLTGNY